MTLSLHSCGAFGISILQCTQLTIHKCGQFEKCDIYAVIIIIILVIAILVSI